MANDKVADSPNVGDDGLSASERDHKARIEKLYRWMKSMKRRC